MLVRGQQYKYRGHVVHFLREVGLVSVRRQAVVIWLNYLRRHHPGYRCIVIDEERLSQLPENGNILDAIPQSQVEAADVGPEEDHEAEPDLEDEAAVPDLLARTRSSMLRGLFSLENQKLMQSFPRTSRLGRNTSCSSRIYGTRQ
ncbi:Beta-ketoacyl synthase [Hirsutella rhossiliensis]